MVQRGAEVLPQRRVRTGVVRGKQKRQHVNDAGDTDAPDPHTERQGQPDRKFAVSDEKGNRGPVWQDEFAQDPRHERISAFSKESIDPMLKSAAERELHSEDFVFAEQEKENPNRHAKICNGAGVLVRRVCGRLHEGSGIHFTVEVAIVVAHTLSFGAEGIVGLAQQSFLEQSLHIASTIQDAVDCDGDSIDAVNYPVGFESDLSKLGDPDVLQFRRNVAPMRQGAKRVTSALEGVKQSIRPFSGIVLSHVPVNFEEVVFGVDIELNVMLSHS